MSAIESVRDETAESSGPGQQGHEQGQGQQMEPQQEHDQQAVTVFSFANPFTDSLQADTRSIPLFGRQVEMKQVRLDVKRTRRNGDIRNLRRLHTELAGGRERRDGHRLWGQRISCFCCTGPLLAGESLGGMVSSHTCVSVAQVTRNAMACCRLKAGRVLSWVAGQAWFLSLQIWLVGLLWITLLI
jgi:hypothetical protein